MASIYPRNERSRIQDNRRVPAGDDDFCVHNNSASATGGFVPGEVESRDRGSARSNSTGRRQNEQYKCRGCGCSGCMHAAVDRCEFIGNLSESHLQHCETPFSRMYYVIIYCLIKQ